MTVLTRLLLGLMVGWTLEEEEEEVEKSALYMGRPVLRRRMML